MYKEHDVIRVVVDDYEFITTPNDETRDAFAKLPKGTRGTIVYPPSENRGGALVEFLYIEEHYPDADPVVFVEFDQMGLISDGQ